MRFELARRIRAFIEAREAAKAEAEAEGAEAEDANAFRSSPRKRGPRRRGFRASGCWIPACAGMSGVWGNILFAHDLIRKQVPTFRGHAPAPCPRRAMRA